MASHLAAPNPRSMKEREIQRLLDAADRLMRELDDEDGDADLEPTNGSLGVMPWSDQRRWADGNTDEREEVSEDEGAQDEREPDPGDDAINYHQTDQRLLAFTDFLGGIHYRDAGVG